MTVRKIAAVFLVYLGPVVLYWETDYASPRGDILRIENAVELLKEDVEKIQLVLEDPAAFDAEIEKLDQENREVDRSFAGTKDRTLDRLETLAEDSDVTMIVRYRSWENVWSELTELTVEAHVSGSLDAIHLFLDRLAEAAAAEQLVVEPTSFGVRHYDRAYVAELDLQVYLLAPKQAG